MMYVSKEITTRIGWIGRVPPVEYAKRLHNLKVKVSEALFVMSSIREMGWDYQELVVRELIKLQDKELGRIGCACP